jgi:hypothetical protein
VVVERVDDWRRMARWGTKPVAVAVVLLLGAGLMACTPTVALQAPKEPITINLNIKIEQEVRIKVEKDLDQVFAKKSNIF